MNVRGKAFVFGDRIDTDLLAPGPYMRDSLPVLASHCLEAIDPGFASEVRQGDIVVGGESFGIGSSREQAVQALAQLGVGAIVATGNGKQARVAVQFGPGDHDVVPVRALERRFHAAFLNKMNGPNYRGSGRSAQV